MKGIVSFVCTFQHQAYHLLCRSRYALVANTDKGYALTITNVVIWCINVRRPEGKSIIQFRIPCQLVNSSTSKKKLFFFFCPHTLTFCLNRLIVSLKHGEGKCEGKLSPLTLALTPKSVYNPICPVKVQSKSSENQNSNQKEKSKNESVQRFRDKSVIIRERFLI